MASQTMTCSYMENSKDFNNTSTDESFNFSTSSDSTDEEYPSKSIENEYIPKHSSTLSKRKPTRKPDPNTFNRNALMARENRRRKKEYVEKLEKEINVYRGTNKNLRKIFKKQSKLIEQLQKEKRYYRNILENKSQILSVIKSLNTKECLVAIPLTNGSLTTSAPYKNSTDNLNITNNNFGDIGTTINQDPFLSTAFSDNESLFTDYNLSFGNHDSWEEILGSNSPFSEQTHEIPTMQQDSLQEIQSNIIDEHNYFNTKTFYEDSDDLCSDAGICLHFTSGGKISLEFCPTCHQKSSNKTIFDKLMDE